MSSPLTITETEAPTTVNSAQGEWKTYPGSAFELFQPYPPAGDQPVAISQLVEGMRDGEMFQTLLLHLITVEFKLEVLPLAD